MKIMPCPLNGPRNITEFICAGEVRVMPDPASVDDAAWADYVFMETNAAGIVREWWCHVPTSYWFIAERNTVSDEILRTYPASDLFTARRDFAPKSDKGP
ncbi:MAG: sarcosine oxidase subunit delta [Alphaproteobacteria bacterium]